jgi:hypothetical protein
MRLFEKQRAQLGMPLRLEARLDAGQAQRPCGPPAPGKDCRANLQLPSTINAAFTA